jgi:hypothetical protein
VSQSTWQTTAAQHQLERLKSMAALVDLPPEVVGEHLPEEIARWYEVWRKRYAAARAALNFELIAAGRQAVQVEETLAARKLDEHMRTVDERLGAAHAPSQETLVVDASTQLASLARTQAQVAHYLDPASAGSLQLRHPRATTDPLLGRFLTAVAVLLLGAAAAWLLADRALPAFTPAAVAAGIGVVWWLLWAPSFLGLLGFVLAVGIVIWSRWQGFRSQLT